MHHLDDTVRTAAAVATFLVSLGIIWRYLIRPVASIVSEMREERTYLRRQLTEGNGADTLRAQIDRIEDRQAVGTEAFRYLADEVKDLRAQQGQQAQAVTALQATLRTMAATTQQIAVTVADVQQTTSETAEAVEVVHEAVTHLDGEPTVQ